jgi:leucyl-tRNA synthetase
MAVPAHDSRDFAFAKHFDLPILPVVAIPQGHDLNTESYDAKEGKLTNSDFLNGLDVKDAIKKAIEYIEKPNIGKGKTNFRLRDAIFGRQRYWGEPIPVYYKNGIPYCLPEDKLPLELPAIDKFLPTEDGDPPLARAEKWMWDETKQEVSTEGFPIETTTMPGWAGSSWYFLRYMDPTCFCFEGSRGVLEKRGLVFGRKRTRHRTFIIRAFLDQIFIRPWIYSGKRTCSEVD